MTRKDKRPAKREAPPSGDAASSASPGQALRQRAEAAFRGNSAGLPDKLDAEKLAALSPRETQLMLHELHVHQVELEMQNEELRRAQLELDSSRARYIDLYDLAPVSYCTISEAGLILEANLTAATLLGVARSMLVKRPISRFIYKADQDIYYLHFKRLLETSEPQAFELRMVKNEGTHFWAHWTTTAAQHADRAPELRAVLTDITARKQAQEARQTSEARLSGLVSSVLDAVITIDSNHRITLFNPAAEIMFGLTCGEVLGSKLDRLIPSRFRSTHSDRIHGYGETKISSRTMGKSGEVVGLRPDGGEFPIDASIAQLEVNGEKMFTVVLRDITERKRLDQVLKEKNAELERAMFVAEKASLAKSEFLSSMSHELRTPLNAILGFSQLMESASPPPTPSQKRNIDQVLRAGWYLLELINEILDLALIESGKLSLSMEPVSLGAVMRECQAMIEPQAKKRGIGVVFPQIKVPYFVKADPTRVKQILINLLSNAIKYNKVDGTVTVDCFANSPGRVRINVEDTGEGLTADKLTQLFQPFNRLGQETSAEEGTGIGLVVSKRLIELMGGVIGVESTVGRGSVFWIELNLTTEEQPDAGAVGLTVVDRAEFHADGRLRTVLYVEDNPANLLLVKHLIARRSDIRFLSAVDGTRGIEIARASQPDVILMDINLPGISGIQALKILDEDPSTAHIQVIALSANAMPLDIEKGLEAGFCRYLTKPIKVNELMDALDVALKLAKTETDRAGENGSAC